ncbi:MAG: terminase small subunit [Nitrospirales bacterium]
MTPRRETFCQEIVKGTRQSEAYRVAFQPKRASAKTVYEKASRLIKQPNVATRIKELMAPIIAAVQLTREQWIEDAIRLYNGDVRKMFDKYGKLLDISLLGDKEAGMIEGYEVVENFTKVKHNEDGTEQALCTGYTKKIKLTSFLNRHEYVGKAMGFYTEKHHIDGGFTVEQLVALIVPKQQRREPNLVKDLIGSDA